MFTIPDKGEGLDNVQGAATRGILKNFTASGELVFSGTKLLAAVRTSSSVWEGEVTSGGVIGSSFIGVWG